MSELYALYRLAPVWVNGQLREPPGHISGATRALMEKAQRECEEAALRREAGEVRVPDGDDSGDPDGFVVDPFRVPR